MSHFDYKVSIEINAKDYPFYALIMAAMRQADTENLFRLKQIFPMTYKELEQRYYSEGGKLEGDK